MCASDVTLGQRVERARETVIAWNLLSTFTQSTIPFLGYEKELLENRDAKDTSFRNDQKFF